MGVELPTTRRNVAVIGGTGSISDFLVRDILDPIRDVLQSAAWWLIVALAAIIGWAKTATGNLHLGMLILATLPIIAALIILANKLPAKP